jgi:flavodoxin
MNTLFLYDSRFGNTELLARTMAFVLGEHGLARLVRVEQAGPHTLTGVDLLVLADPTERHGVSPAFHTWLDSVPVSQLRELPFAVFDTRRHLPGWLSGSAAHTIAHRLEQAGAVPVVPPESFFITDEPAALRPGEMERADAWAHRVRAAYAAFCLAPAI